MAKQLTLPDGRNLDYYVSEPVNSQHTIVWLHGTPGAYIPLRSLEQACHKQGTRLVSFSRAGYGNSSRKIGRQVADIASDVDALVKHLGVDKFAAVGLSGGGPHSLACAARSPACKAAAVLSGVGPSDAPDLDFLAGQGEGNVKEYEATRAGEPTIQAFCADARPSMLSADLSQIMAELDSLLPQVDKDVLTSSEDLGSLIVDSTREGLKNNSDGWVDDDLAFINSWGFDLAEIKVPTFVYHGSADMMAPFAHGQWTVKHLPKEFGHPHLEQGQGHLSMFIGKEEQIVAEVVGALSKLG